VTGQIVPPWRRGIKPSVLIWFLSLSYSQQETALVCARMGLSPPMPSCFSAQIGGCAGQGARKGFWCAGSLVICGGFLPCPAGAVIGFVLRQMPEMPADGPAFSFGLWPTPWYAPGLPPSPMAKIGLSSGGFFGFKQIWRRFTPPCFVRPRPGLGTSSALVLLCCLLPWSVLLGPWPSAKAFGYWRLAGGASSPELPSWPPFWPGSWFSGGCCLFSHAAATKIGWPTSCRWLPGRSAADQPVIGSPLRGSPPKGHWLIGPSAGWAASMPLVLAVMAIAAGLCTTLGRPPIRLPGNFAQASGELRPATWWLGARVGCRLLVGFFSLLGSRVAALFLGPESAGPSPALLPAGGARAWLPKCRPSANNRSKSGGAGWTGVRAQRGRTACDRPSYADNSVVYTASNL